MTSPPAGPPSGTPAEKNDGAHPATVPSPDTDDAVLLTTRQNRRAVREERRQAKDAAYELRQERKRAKDGTSLRGHHIVNAQGLADAFPPPESTELETFTVRRRILHGSILVILLALLVAGLVLAGMVQRGELDLRPGYSKPTPPPEICPSEILTYAPNTSVTVNVFNGGSTEGRAGQVAEDLKKRGFVVKDIANTSTELAAPSVIIAGPKGHAAALTLQRNFPNSEYVEDKRVDATVDVILTANYGDLGPEVKVDMEPGVLSCPRLSPPPSTPAVATPAPSAAK
ncbi:LytR C-terminal domain-containing protein [Arthrobacter psychrolactophilus]